MNPSKGIANGTRGVLHSVTFEKGYAIPKNAKGEVHVPQPKSVNVLVTYDDGAEVIVPVKTQRDTLKLRTKNTVAINKLEFALGWSYTYHKTQGLTCPKLVLALGRRKSCRLGYKSSRRSTLASPG